MILNMGCKCANAEEDNDEIKKNAVNDGNEDNEYNKNFNQNEDLLGLNNQENLYQEEENDPAKIKESNQNNNFYDNNNINNNDPYAKYSDYPEKIVELINNIREDPSGYADVIEDSIKNIIEEEDKNDPSNIRLIYKKKVKVALTKGESAFHEAAEILRTLPSLPPLEFKTEICIPLPENEEQLRDPTFLREQVRMIREDTQIDVFFKDLVKIPEVSGLLMIVDDTNKNAGKKRLALLNKDLKYIGVTSKFVGKTFIAYFAFSK